MFAAEVENKVVAILGQACGTITRFTSGIALKGLGVVVVGEATAAQRAELAKLATYYAIDIQLDCTPKPDPIQQHGVGDAINRFTALMVRQREKGLAKYGVPVEDAPLDASAWLQHMVEEMADCAVYAMQLQKAITAEREQAVADFAAQIREVLSDPTMGRVIKLEFLSEMVTNWEGVTRCQVMYAQQSELEKFNSTGANLLTLSRTKDNLVFKTPLKVIA